MKKTVLSMIFVLAVSGAIAQGNGTFQNLGAGEGFVILNDLALYLEKSGSLEFKETMVIGDRVAVMGRVSKFKLDGKERDFIKVKAASGTEGWARSSYIAQNAGLAVVRVDKSSIYSEPRVVKMTGAGISKMTVVAVLKDSPADYVKVVGYDIAKNAYYTDPVFIAREDLTFADADINATILYLTALNSKNKDVRANLLSFIQKKYPSSIFMAFINTSLNPPAAEVSSDKKVIPASGFYLVNDNKVNVRSAPDEKNGTVTLQVNKRLRVEVAEVTELAYTIDGVTAAWYRLKDPAGWVFGSFLTKE